MKETPMYGPRMMLGPEGKSTARGVLFVHSAPSALCPHIEWAVGGVLGTAVSPAWIPQPAQSGTYRSELSWSGDSGSAAGIASALRGWNHLRFEVTEDPTASSEGQRYSYTPELGVFHAVTGLHGDIMIPEDRLKAAVVKAALGDTTLLTEIDKLLGKPWDDELEPFRHAGEGAPVRWLHQVV
jgi:hypothetical protein